jgi:hypothetical protein
MSPDRIFLAFEAVDRWRTAALHELEEQNLSPELRERRRRAIAEDYRKHVAEIHARLMRLQTGRRQVG